MVQSAILTITQPKGDTATSSAASGLGHLPIISLASATGLLLVSVSNVAARTNLIWAQPLFWFGLLMLLAPIIGRLLSVEASRHERIALVVLLGLGLYWVKLLHSPIDFTFYDEFSHWRNTRNTLTNGALFLRNPLLLASAFYPGLASVTSALVSLSGLSIFQAGILVIGAARLTLMLALFCFFEQVSRSPRIAGLATLLYATHPNFIFFDAQFAYESLAIPMLALVLYLVAARARDPLTNSPGIGLIIVLGILALTITHHMTSYALVGLLGAWMIAAWLLGHKRLSLRIERLTTRAGSIAASRLPRQSRWFAREPGTLAPQAHDARIVSPTGPFLLAVICILAWIAYVASITIRYLGPVLGPALIEFLQLISGESGSRELFVSAGRVAPLIERLASLASVLFILLGLPFGLLQIGRHYAKNTLALVLGLVTLAYPASMILRLTQAGAETSNRSSGFLFLALAFTLAIGVSEFWLQARPSRLQRMTFIVWAAVIFAGGLIVGWGGDGRQPGPYMVVADTRSIEPQGISAARWASTFLGAENTVFTDRINRQLMGSYGLQNPILGSSGNYDVSLILLSQNLEIAKEIIRAKKVEYLVVDWRLSYDLPAVGVYFDEGEPFTNAHTSPIDTKLLTRYDTVPQVSRVFDSGDIWIYDVGVLLHE